MMKFTRNLILISATFFIALPAFSQNTKSHKKTSAAKPELSAEKSKMLCKAWQLDTVSAFGVDNKATAKEANDGITFVADGSLFITQEGVAATGKWAYSGGGINTETTNPDNKLSFRIISLSDDKMVLEYQYPAPDLSKVQYTYSPKK